ncbi:hypothetical protein O181_044788 [Austropuccinia psidii MF-1]|uniref:Uncharacterized protein n=1 Tax=Austropuccinia psidii MF-1 TaxID=1389203 RepID=A0A9Q3HGY8_9BASI|nr:hypothetical protein [Austropuccinia psidii MF-1]
MDIPYPPVLTRPAYPASLRDREALEKHIQELIKLGVLRKVGHNEEFDVKNPVTIAWHNDKLRMLGDLRALNTYTVQIGIQLLASKKLLPNYPKTST